MIIKSNNLCVAFRVDGGSVLSWTFEQMLINCKSSFLIRGVKSIFIISDSSIREKIRLRYGYKIFRINKSKESLIVEKILKRENCKIIIIDSKRQSTMNILRHLQNVKTVVIDNPKLGKYADLVILPGVKEQFGNYPKNSLVGENYVILGPNFPLTKKFKKNEYILTSTGGSDKRNITYRVVSSFSKLNSNFKMLVILGSFYKYEKNIRKLIGNDKRFKIVKDPKNLPELMAGRSVGIITFGVMVYEAAAGKFANICNIT